MTELEQRLRDLDIAFPETPDVLGAALTRLEPRPAPTWRRRAVLVLAVVMIALVGAFALSPGARATLLEWFGLRGVTVTRVDEVPDASRFDPLGLGERVTLDRARAAVEFPIAVPGGASAAPRQVYLDTTVPGGAVTMTSCCDPTFLFTQLEGSVTPVVEKLVGSGGDISRVDVDGRPGLWVEGDHLLLYVDATETVRELRARVAGNALLWEGDGVLYRLEGVTTLEQALGLARSVR